MPPPSDPFLPGRMALGLLATALSSIERGSNGKPERVMVTYANPVDDCKNALTVYVPAIEEFLGTSFPQPRGGSGKQPCGRATQLPMIVRLVRCVTGPKDTGTPPSAETQQTEALGLLEDGWRLWHGLIAAWKDGTLLGDEVSVGCSNVALGNLGAIPQQGGAAGWQMKITVQTAEVTAIPAV